ncbi:anti-sigma factor antagonist [Methanofollis formosanus]|uniref:Anti-sigma factor antagonist n=1 Tax=Methanofollis formosanus TaxID=299308 RepID=A0A8G1EGV6_9EURY|nr:STAS domain-containing protein [Methanofollis formosanus]QYZ80233.1 anti-sigma factor antagonist [Methanofollis formosanus]
MEMRSEREAALLTVMVSGRLDGYAAEELKAGIDGALQDDDRAVVVDLAGTDYLSSAGIRVFLALQKQMKARGGCMTLCSVEEYPMEVLSMAGFDRVFSIVPSREEARRICLRKEESLSLIADLEQPAVEVDGMKVRFEPGTRAPAHLRMHGALDPILSARLAREEVRAVPLSDLGYALGIGALGGSRDEATERLGEMVALRGAVAWLPTDGHGAPDFLVPAFPGGGEGVAYTAFDLALDGPFHEVAVVEAGSEEGFTLEALYRALLALAERRRPDFGGVVATALWGVTAGVAGAAMTQVPLAEKGFGPDEFDRWVDRRDDLRHGGDTLLAFGIAADRAAAGQEEIAALCPTLPGEPDEKDLCYHAHGAVFRHVPWDDGASLEKGIDRCFAEGEVVDVCHLLGSTRLRRAKVGVAYVTPATRE